MNIKYYCIVVYYYSKQKKQRQSTVFPQRYTSYEEAVTALTTCMTRNRDYVSGKSFSIIGEDEHKRYVWNIAQA